MSTEDPILSGFTEDQALLQRARLDQLHEALRLLACQAAYCERYRATLPLGELVKRIRSADRDPVGAALVSEGLAYLNEVLRLLYVTPDGPEPARSGV